MSQDYNPDEIDVHIAELLIATPDSADPLLHPKVKEALHILREHMKMDVVFVSQFKGNRRTFKVVEAGHKGTKLIPGQSDPLEETWCKQVVDGRLPQLVKDASGYAKSGAFPAPGVAIGTVLSTPVVLKNGNVYGTLCCFSRQIKEDVSQLDLQRLQMTAKLLAEDLLDSHMSSELELEPLPEPEVKSKS